MYDKLVLVWRNPYDRTWVPVGLLIYQENQYIFHYTEGAKSEGFIPFGQMRELAETYVSDELFPIFKNRLLAKSRPEYGDFLDWLDITKENNNALLELSRSRGIRATDDLQLFPLPKKNANGEYEVIFFSHGMSHLASSYINRLQSLKNSEQLLIMKDVQNETDSLALALRAKDDPVELLGYCPAFFVQDFNSLMKLNGDKDVRVTVQKINHEAPLQLKLLCRLTTKWPQDFKVFDSVNFKPYKNVFN